MGDSLFPVYNNFFIGAFQAAINEASDLQGLSDTESTERDCYMYRSYIALGSYQLVIDEINDSAPTALQAVKMLAVYLSRPFEKEKVLETIVEWLSDSALMANATVLLVAATIYSHEGNFNDALKCCHSALSLELMALMIHLLIKMDRVELANKHLSGMQSVDDDATLTQLSTAWVNIAQGGAKVQDGFYVFQELGDKYSWTPKLYNGSAVCHMQMGQYEDAEKDLLEAINKDTKDVETLTNLAVCSLHLGKPITRFINQMKTLTPKPAAVEGLEKMDEAFEAANSTYA